MKIRKYALIPMVAVFLNLTGCSDKEGHSGLPLDPAGSGTNLAASRVDRSDAIDARKSPFFLVYEDFENVKTAKELAADYKAMRQKYIKPLLATDAEKKEFAQKLIENIGKFNQLKNYDDFMDMVEDKLGMSLEDAANMEIKTKESSSLAAWGDYSTPPNGQWVYEYSNNGTINSTNGLYCPSFGNSNAISNNSMTWNPGSPVQLWGRLVGANENYSTGAGVFGYYEPPLAQNSSSTGSITKQVSFTAAPGSAYIVTSQANLYQGSQGVIGLVSRTGSEIYWYNIRKGDTDYDGDVDDVDVIKVAYYVCGLDLTDPNYKKWAGDTNGDGIYDIIDLRYMDAIWDGGNGGWYL